MTIRAVVCPYCDERAELVDSAAVYSRSYGMIWLCRPCNAWVGTHRNSENHAPLGTLADEKLRALRQLVHAAFDPIWKDGELVSGPGGGARRRAYVWLAAQLGISHNRCHIGMFRDDLCHRAVEVSRLAKWADVVDWETP